MTTVGEAIRRALLLGDVHGERARLQTALTLAATVDAMLCVGDLPAKGYALTGEPTQTIGDCASLLRAASVRTVRGNHDRYFAENAADPALAELFKDEWAASRDALRFVQNLPRTLRLQTVAGELLLCHGVGDNDTAGIYPGGDDAPVAEALKATNAPRFVVAGHTHRRVVRTVAGITIINPGALVGDKEPPGFAVADFDDGTVTFYRFDERGAATPNAVLTYNEA